jgi:hypothetical protein
MKKALLIFLKILIILIGIGAVVFLIWEPQVEGVNANATNFEIYFKDPFLAFAYIASIPFFIALYQAFKVLQLAGRNEMYSQMSVNAVRTIKKCALAIIGFAIIGEIIILLNADKSDDAAGGIMMGVFIILSSIVVATAAAKFARMLQSRLEIKA